VAVGNGTGRRGEGRECERRAIDAAAISSAEGGTLGSILLPDVRKRKEKEKRATSRVRRNALTADKASFLFAPFLPPSLSHSHFSFLLSLSLSLSLSLAPPLIYLRRPCLCPSCPSGCSGKDNRGDNEMCGFFMWGNLRA
jgi:hypothetical protein